MKNAEAKLKLIKAPIRRIDTIANVLQGFDPAIAVYFDDQKKKIFFASNKQSPSVFTSSIVNYLKQVALIALTEIDSNNVAMASGGNADTNLVNKLNKLQSIGSNAFIKHANIMLDNPEVIAELRRSEELMMNTSQNWHQEFLNSLEKINQSIFARCIIEKPGLRQYFSDIGNPERIAFSKEFIEALASGIEYYPGKPNVHAELKLTQKLLDEYFTDWHQDNASNAQYYIGISKKCCLNCQNSIEAVNKVFALPPQPQFSELPIRGKILTRDGLIQEPGSLLPFPAAVPDFLIQNNKNTASDLNQRIISEFEKSRGKPVKSAFAETLNDYSHAVKSKQIRSRSKSPTSQDIELISKNQVSEAIAIAQTVLPQEEIKRSFVEKLKPPKNNKASKKHLAKKQLSSAAQDDNALLEEALKNAEVEREQFMAREKLHISSQPILLFYDADESHQYAIIKLLPKLKSIGVRNLIVVDTNLASINKSPLQWAMENHEILQKNLAHFERTGETQRVKAISDLVVYADLLKKADQLGFTIHNAANKDLCEAYQNMTDNIIRAVPLNDTEALVRAMINEVKKPYRNKKADLIADKVEAQCQKHQGSIVIADLRDGKNIMHNLTSRGLHNAASYCIFHDLNHDYNQNEIEIFKYCLRFLQPLVQTFLPKSIIVDGEDKTNEQIVQEITPYLPEPAIQKEKKTGKSK